MLFHDSSGLIAYCSDKPVGRSRLLYFGGLVLADMAVAITLHSVELSSWKCDVLISHFQTAVFSVGVDIDAIKHERSPRFKGFNIKSQMMQKQHVAPVPYGNNN